MKKHLDLEERKFYVQRPIPDGVMLDHFQMPVIKALHENEVDLESLVPINFQNIHKEEDNSHKLVLNYRYDSLLNQIWEKALQYIPLVVSFGAIVTPDFSVSASMNVHWLNQYVFRNRYLGCLWQSYGAKVIPSIPWDTPSTYDICFSGIEPGGIVCISTLGVKKNLEVFFAGFEEMKRRLQPSVIIVYGKIFQGMHGRFLSIPYTDAFAVKRRYQQGSLFHLPKVFSREVE